MITILVERRQTLHSSRLFDHLRASNQVMQSWMTTASNMLSSRGGYSALTSHDVATKLLAEVGGREVTTLAYADAFLFMALIGLITLSSFQLFRQRGGEKMSHETRKLDRQL